MSVEISFESAAKKFLINFQFGLQKTFFFEFGLRKKIEKKIVVKIQKRISSQFEF